MFLIYRVNPQHTLCVDQYSVIMFIVHRQTVNMTLGVQMFANSTVIHSVINQASWSLFFLPLPPTFLSVAIPPQYVLSCLAKCQCVFVSVCTICDCLSQQLNPSWQTEANGKSTDQYAWTVPNIQLCCSARVTYVCPSYL